MKNNLLKFILTFAAVAMIAACNKDDDGASSCSDGKQNGDETGVDCGGSCTPCETAKLQGDKTEDTTLDASLEYELTGAYIVKSGSKLTIPAGTTIKAAGGTSAYIAVERGAQIFINGTASAPVVMTSGATDPSAGDWGGLVICGDAPTNKG